MPQIAPSCHYYRVSWIDTLGRRHLSDPLTRWTDAELYRRTMLPDMLARIIDYASADLADVSPITHH